MTLSLARLGFMGGSAASGSLEFISELTMDGSASFATIVREPQPPMPQPPPQPRPQPQPQKPESILFPLVKNCFRTGAAAMA